MRTEMNLIQRDARRKKRRIMFRLSCFVLVLLIFAVSYAASAHVWPEKGKKTKSGGSLTVDNSNTTDGYFWAQGEKTSKKYKLRVTIGNNKADFDLANSGSAEVIPLVFGNGEYTATLYKQASGSKYSQSGRATFNVKLTDEFAPFLCPNQYVWYTEDSPVVAASLELCADAKTDKEKFELISEYVPKHVLYDFVKMVTVKTGTTPDIDGCFKKGMGICQDQSAIMVCMLRVQGIPARLTVGYADKSYHAWVTAYIDGEWVQFDPTVACGAISKPEAYTVERYY